MPVCYFHMLVSRGRWCKTKVKVSIQLVYLPSCLGQETAK